MSYEWNSHYQTNRSGTGNSYDPNVPYGGTGSSYDPNMPYSGTGNGYNSGYFYGGTGVSNSTANTAGSPSYQEEQQITPPNTAGAEVIPFYDGTKYQSKAIILFVALFFLAVVGAPVGSILLENDPSFNFDRMFPIIFFGMLILLFIFLLVVTPLMDYFYLKRVCTCRSTGKFVDYEKRPVRIKTGKHSYKTFTGYYPRFLVDCNGKKQIRTYTSYSRSPQEEPDKVLLFNPKGRELYEEGDKTILYGIMIKAGMALLIIVTLGSMIMPSVLAMFK